MTMHRIPISVDRVIYVSLRDTESVPPGWVKVSRTLPRSAQASHIYEVRPSANSA